MAYGKIVAVQSRGRGMTDITRLVADAVADAAIATGIVHVFVRHTSCSVAITENADPAVRQDLETLAQRWAPDADPAYCHDMEGDDDMSAHARSLLSGASVTVPVHGGRLVLGTWQGIFLWEHRAQSLVREVAITVVG
jgi:secondary thiamine-phosphate synthase enzyme